METKGKVHKRKASNKLRIIGGDHRRRLLDFPDVPGLRPTPDRVRETLFNWLGQTLDGKQCLDLFAGSGGLGFEALSRHAAGVVMVETDRQALASLQHNAQTLGLRPRIVAGDALAFLQRDSSLYDVIFLDPPFHQGWFERLLPQLAAHVAADGMVYLESEQPLLPPDEFTLERSGKAGMVHYALWRKRSHAA